MDINGDLTEEYDFDSYGILIAFRKDLGDGLEAQNPKEIGVLSRNEFLFASTSQGGTGALGRMVPGIENSVQGGELGATFGLLGRFYDTALKGSWQPFMVLPINL